MKAAGTALGLIGVGIVVQGLYGLAPEQKTRRKVAPEVHPLRRM